MTTADELRANIRANIAEAKACSNNDFIFCWGYGYGVKLTHVPGGEIKADVCSIKDATSVRANSQTAYRVIENGAGERATLVRRQVALAREIAANERLLNTIAAL